LQGFRAAAGVETLRAMRTRFVLPLAAALALAAPVSASASFEHTVAAGETLSSVAAADGLSVDQLAAANGLSRDSRLIAGSTLSIPPQTASAAGETTTAQTATTTGEETAGDDDAAAATTASSGYVVQPGDTLTAIAARAGTTVEALAAANGLNPNGVLIAGAALTLSGATATTTTSASTADAQPIGAAAEGSPSGPPYPTAESVSASQVGSIASADGVSPSLAEAIGWQESGFNNDLVSSSDARGVMQILPGTWSWIQSSLAGPTPLASSSAADNVRGGVLMLQSLLNSSGGDPALAAAGYYQGLASVQQHGMYPSTQRYVNDVMALARRFGGG
jgi:LysM repeat protein